LVVPIITLTFGWRMAFVATGSLSLIWLVVWIAYYRDPRQHKSVTPAELAYIESDKPKPEKPVPWLRLLLVRETWAFALGKFLTDPIWWFYLFWLPAFFVKKYGLDLKSFGPPIIAIYILSDVGSIAGGWMSSTMIKRGASVNMARKMTMLICAVCFLPVIFTMSISNEWVAVGIVGLATAAHQAFSANLLTLPSDLMPKAAVG
jgi:MFS transporter, ACS family, hexuronate transporter